MSRLLRPCLGLVAAILVLAVAAVLAFNLYLQSSAMQQRLRRATLDTIGLPVNVRSTYYLPWSGIQLRGLVVPDMENQGVNFLEASEFRIAFRLLPLLRREFSVSRLSLQDAVLTWRQTKDGLWRLPRLAEEAVPRPADSPAVATAPPAQPTPAAPGVPAPAEVPAPPAQPVFDIRVDSMEVTRSRIVFENRDAWPLLDAEGITIEARLREGGNAAGKVNVPESVIAGLLVARDLGSPFSLEGGRLEFPDIRCAVAGGELTGRGMIATREEGSPYDWNLRLAKFNLGELRIPPSFGGTKFAGVLHAELELQGRNAPQRQIRGRGEAHVDNARVVPSDYLRELGQMLGIRELQGMDFSEARATVRIEDDLIQVDPLWLKSNDIAIEMRGPVTRKGKLDLKARLLVSPAIAQRISALGRQELADAGVPDLPGYRAVPFRVTGTLQSPQSDLASQLMGGGVGGQIGEFFLNLMGVP